MAFSTPPTPELAISIADNVREVSEGQRVRYHIVVMNPTQAQAPVTIRLTLPPAAVSGIQADDATVVANAIAWKKVIAAGETWTYTVAGTVSPTAQRIEVQACLYVSAQEPALACATDLNTIAATPSVGRFAWLAAIALGLLAVVGALWLHKKINPELLTPASAGAAAGQPGGAPSV